MVNLFGLVALSLSLLASPAVLWASNPNHAGNVVPPEAGRVTVNPPKGSLVEVKAIQGDWAQITHAPFAGDRVSGLVSTNRLRFVSNVKQGRYASFDGGSCTEAGAAGGKVCVTVADVSLKCQQQPHSSLYISCVVDIDYDLTTDHRDNQEMDVGIECSANIAFLRQEQNAWMPDISSYDKHYGLPVQGSGADDMSIGFSFSPHYKITQVRVVSAACTVDSINLAWR